MGAVQVDTSGTPNKAQQVKLRSSLAQHYQPLPAPECEGPWASSICRHWDSSRRRREFQHGRSLLSQPGPRANPCPGNPWKSNTHIIHIYMLEHTHVYIYICYIIYTSIYIYYVIMCIYILYTYINGGASARVANLSRKIVSVYSAGAEYGT